MPMPHIPIYIYRLVVVLMLSVSALPLSAQTTPKIKQLQKQRTELQTQLANSEKLLKTTKKDVASQLNNLAVISSRIAAQQQYVDTIQSEVSALAGDIVVQQNRLAALRRDLSACKHKYRRAVLYMNRNRLMQNRWMFILMSKNFRQMYRRMRYAADYSKFLRAQGAVIQSKEREVKRREAELAAAHRDKDALLGEAKRQHAGLESQKAERQTVINELNKKQRQLQNNIGQQRKKYANLNAQIDKLIKQEIAAAEARRRKAEAEARRRREREARERAAAERRRKQEEAAARKSGKPSKGKPKAAPKSEKRSDTPDFREADAADRTLSGNFRANRGRLPIPITGQYTVTSHYGQYSVEGLRGVTLDSKGINLTGRSGAQARSVYDGEVSAVANIGGSYIVIVRHSGYFSVYSNLASVSVRQGQKVSTRQSLGRVAKDAAGNCTLHFQLRQKSGNSATHINPLPWLAR